MESLLIAIIVALLVVLAITLTRKSGGQTSAPPPSAPAPEPEPAPKKEPTVPERVPVKTREYFFSRSEKIFYDQLLIALDGKDYVVFPKPRLDDIFEPEGERLTQGERNRLLNKHVDYLIVTRKGFKPVLGIELDGSSHNSKRQQHNDAVKEVVFRSAGFPLVRFRNEENAMAPAIRARLTPHLPQL